MEAGREIPTHVAIILDGNGRWAKRRHLPRKAGHAEGARNVERVCRAAKELGIKYITMYAFSTENWKRPKDEVDSLMELLESELKSSIKRAMKNDLRMRVIGDRSVLSESFIKTIDELEITTRDNKGLTVLVALNYGSRDELTRVLKGLVSDAASGKISADDIDEETISSRLDTSDVPDPELLIRTGGEQRLSNYLLWQLAYAEFYFTEVTWPDFDKNELKKAIDYYMHVDRRFGGLKEE
ncbi:MAG TPA: isoprenyl transferase [Lachnospiraceae bacterium]|nr:isoprenyl transferase [Lachnospiraceae bacterium]